MTLAGAATLPWTLAVTGPDLAWRLQNRPGLMAVLTVVMFVAIAASAWAIVSMWTRSPHIQALLRRPWSELEAGRLLALLMFLWLVLWTGVSALHRAGTVDLDNPSTRIVLVVLQTLTLQWPVLGYVGLALWRQTRSLQEAFGMSGLPRLRWVLLAIVLYLATLPLAGMASWLVRTLFPHWTDMSPQPVLEILLETQSGPGRFYLLFLAIVLAPLSEEILFRGILLPVATRRFGVATGLIMTSAVFAIIHAHAASAPVLFVLGISFGLAYLYTNTLWVPVLMHSVFNSASLLLVALLSS